MTREVDKPFAGGRWSEARYYQFIKTAIRRAFVRWPVKADVLKAASRPVTGRGRQKVERQCNECKQWFPSKEVEVDHKEPCGSFSDDPAGYIGRLFCEEDGLQVICRGCHLAKTKAEKARSV